MELKSRTIKFHPRLWLKQCNDALQKVFQWKGFVKRLKTSCKRVHAYQWHYYYSDFFFTSCLLCACLTSQLAAANFASHYSWNSPTHGLAIQHEVRLNREILSKLIVLFVWRRVNVTSTKTSLYLERIFRDVQSFITLEVSSTLKDCIEISLLLFALRY